MGSCEPEILKQVLHVTSCDMRIPHVWQSCHSFIQGSSRSQEDGSTSSRVRSPSQEVPWSPQLSPSDPPTESTEYQINKCMTFMCSESDSLQHVGICACICAYIYIYIHIHISMYIYIYICILCTYICMHIYMRIYMLYRHFILVLLDLFVAIVLLHCVRPRPFRDSLGTELRSF